MLGYQGAQTQNLVSIHPLASRPPKQIRKRRKKLRSEQRFLPIPLAFGIELSRSRFSNHLRWGKWTEVTLWGELCLNTAYFYRWQLTTTRVVADDDLWAIGVPRGEGRKKKYQNCPGIEHLNRKQLLEGNILKALIKTYASPGFNKNFAHKWHPRFTYVTKETSMRSESEFCNVCIYQSPIRA